MPQDSTLKVKLYGPDLSPEDEPDVLYVKYVSFVNNNTYGPPPLIAPKAEGHPSRADLNEEVLYINTSLVPAFSITRVVDLADEDA